MQALVGCRILIGWLSSWAMRRVNRPDVVRAVRVTASCPGGEVRHRYLAAACGMRTAWQARTSVGFAFVIMPLTCALVLFVVNFTCLGWISVCALHDGRTITVAPFGVTMVNL